MTFRSLLLLALLCALSSTTWAGETLTLKECYQRALTRSETVAIQEDTIRIAEAHYLQALGTVLPHLNAKATEIIQDTSGNGSTTPGGSSSVGNTLTRRSRPEVALTLTQPLFQGLREFKALKVANAEKSKNTLQTKRARQLLFSDVARAYYTVLEVERERDIQSSLHGTLAKRVSELKERMRLGKSRESELLTTESQMAAIEADLEKAKGQINVARDYLGFLIGDEVKQRLVDEFKTPSALPPVENYIAFLNRRPDLGASEQSVRLAQGQLDYQKGARYPNLNFEGTYYPYRVGFQKDIHWDMAFTLNVPLFQGGATRGLIREASAKLDQARLSDDLANRQAELEVRQAYNHLKSSRSQETALRRAESKAAQSFQSQQEEYRLGLVNNLDVLQALRDWHERRLAANLAYFSTKLDYLNILVSSGDIELKVGDL